MRRIILYLMILAALTAVNLLSGCDTHDIFMDEEDRLPKMEVFAQVGDCYIVPAMTGYCLYTKIEDKIYVCDMPTGVLKFDMYIESYDINQPFEIEVIFPTDDIEYLQHFDPEDRPTVAKWPQTAAKIPITWPMIHKSYTSDNGRGPGGYMTVPVAVWGPTGGQMSWAPKYDSSFFCWDSNDPDFIQPEITFILTDAGGRKVVRKIPLWVNIYNLCVPCPGG